MDKGENGFSLVWPIVTVLGILWVAGAGFFLTGVQCTQVFARPYGIGTPFRAEGRQVQTAGTRASTNAQQKFFSLLRIEDAEDALPQFVLQGKVFTVVIHKQRLKWPAEAQHRFDPDDDETARSFEVRDATGVAVYRQKIEEAAGESELAEIRKQGRFAFTEAVYASRMQGARNQALVIGWSSIPSAPDSCSTLVVLGLFEGKLVPFSEPFCEDIISSGPESPDRTWKLEKDPGTDFEIFEIRRGYGFFHVIVPIRVDFVMAKLFPARWCIRTGAPAPLADHCEFPVETERTAAREDTFVRLFASADDSGTPRHVVVKPNSRIEFLAALAPNAMDRSGKWTNEQSGRIPWLRLRIDGKEGWVHAEEDLNALGLFQAG
jgi:hypothetical protein